MFPCPYYQFHEETAVNVDDGEVQELIRTLWDLRVLKRATEDEIKSVTKQLDLALGKEDVYNWGGYTLKWVTRKSRRPDWDRINEMGIEVPVVENEYGYWDLRKKEEGKEEDTEEEG